MKKVVCLNNHMNNLNNLNNSEKDKVVETKLTENKSMETKIFDCRPLRAEKEEKLRTAFAVINAGLVDARTGKSRVATLAIVQVGKVPESTLFIEQKKKCANKLGVMVLHVELPEGISEGTLEEEVRSLSHRSDIDGVIVQLPLPPHILPRKIIDAISPQKDVDGLTSSNITALYEGREGGIMPATAKGIGSILDAIGINCAGKNAVVVGRSIIAGKSIALSLLNRNATVTICHSKTKDLAKITSQADILVSAVGIPGLITSKHVKVGQVVIDVGISKMVGDVCATGPESVDGIISIRTPVPYGVGQMTVISLFENLLFAMSLK